MILRSDFLEEKYTFKEYFSQFVNNEVKNKVLKIIGKEALLKSKDKHLNDIPVKKWDTMSGFIWSTIGGSQVAISKPQTPEDVKPIDAQLLKDTGEGVSCAGLVCIYKEAAKQLIEEFKNNKIYE